LVVSFTNAEESTNSSGDSVYLIFWMSVVNQNPLLNGANPEPNPPMLLAQRHPAETHFGYPRNFLNNRFVYVVISPRAGGLSVGINLTPDKRCDFDCAYCEVNRKEPGEEAAIRLDVMSNELTQTLQQINQGRLREWPAYRNIPEELLQLRHVALSGEGEPTLSPHFVEVIQSIVHIRALGHFPFFKAVLITNATGLDTPEVKYGLNFFTKQDEIWAKLDAGTQAWMDKVNRARVPLEKVLSNILLVGRQRPIIIESLFPMLNGVEPPEEEVVQFAQRVRELRENGAQISMVQIYSATRPTLHSEYGHLPLRSLSRISHTVRQVAGVKAEVF
jgi:wyosine [tRNA(Phe)-imidazoG37] synthetase (radical SAM superfamily)